MTENDRSIITSIAANYGWANTVDRAARSAKGQAGLLDSFLEKVRPEITDPEQRAKAAENLRKAHMQQLARQSAKVRKANAEARKQLEEDAN